MKKLITFLLITCFAIAGFAQELKTEYIATSTTQFGIYMKAPIQVYLADSAKTYLLLSDQTKLKTMSNVFALGATYYTQVTGGSSLETETDALSDSITAHRTDIDNTVLETDTNATGVSTNLSAITTLNNRADHDPDTAHSAIVKYPLMAVAEYDYTYGYASDTGSPPRTIYLEGSTNIIPDNAIITKVVMDIVRNMSDDDNDGLFKFGLPTDGDLTRETVVADGSNIGVYFGTPFTYALDGAALTDTLMSDSIAASFIKTTAARPVTITVNDTMAGGHARLFIWYVVSE